MPVALLRRSGRLMDVRPADGSMFPPEVLQALQSCLTYTHRQFLRGPDAWDETTGASVPVRARPVEMYQFDESGRLVFRRGFLPRVKQTLLRFGYTAEVAWLDGPRARPNCFEFQPVRVFERMELRNRQDEMLCHFATSEGGILVAFTGAGKTYTMASVCLAFPNAKILIVTFRKDVLGRIMRHLTRYIPDVGIVTGGKTRWRRVTVMSAKCLHKVEHTPEGEPDIVIYDECHEAGAGSICEELSRFEWARMFGMTASFGLRFDGADFQLEGIFGPPLMEITYQQGVEMGAVPPIQVEWVDVSDDRKPFSDLKNVQFEKRAIWTNDARNERISVKAKEFADDVQVLILVATFEHAVNLKKFLPDFRLCYADADESDYGKAVKSGYLDPRFDPPMTPALRENLARSFEEGTIKKCIATDVWSVGVDFVHLAVLIRADARASEIMDIQGPGRVTRHDPDGGKAYGLVVDTMDYFDNRLLGRSRSRLRSYRRLGWSPEPTRGGRRAGIR